MAVARAVSAVRVEAAARGVVAVAVAAGVVVVEGAGLASAGLCVRRVLPPAH